MFMKSKITDNSSFVVEVKGSEIVPAGTSNERDEADNSR